MPVISGTVTVDGNTDSYVMLGKELTELLIERDTIGVNPQVKTAYATQSGLKFRGDTAQLSWAGKQGLATVPNNLHGFKLVRTCVLSNALRCSSDDLVGNNFAALAPALVGTF